MSIDLKPANQANLRGLFIAATVYCLLVAYNFVHFLHVAHVAGDKPLLPFMPISLGIKAALFNLIFICIHIVAGFLLALPFWLPLLIKKIKSGRKLSKGINWFCMISLLLFVPFNSYGLCMISSEVQYNASFFITFILMEVITIFALFKLSKFEFDQNK